MATIQAPGNIEVRARAAAIHDCPLCGPRQKRAFAECDGCRIVRCAECGLLFVDIRRRGDGVADFYRDEYIPDEQFTELQMVTYRQQSLAREAARLRRLLPQGGRLLDVGTASGAFLNEFAGHSGWQVEGVEPSHVAADYARTKFGLRIHDGYLAEQFFADETFDVVTSLDALMLHPEVNADLQEIGRILKPRGLFAVEIPGLAFRRLTNTGIVGRLLHGTRVNLNPSNHLYYFNRNTLTQLTKKHGFEFVTSYSEQMPIYGSAAARALKDAYFRAAALAYNATGGRLHLCPKEFIVYRKQA